MHEALMLFDSICNSQWFLKTNMVSRLNRSLCASLLTRDSSSEQILFLNKDDVFRQQLENPNSQIGDYFPDYDGPTGPAGYEAGREYFKRQFVGLNRSMSKEVYTQ
jgi:hypothetical protein